MTTMESFTINVYTESGEHRACGRISSIERRGNGWIRCRFAAIRKERFLVRVEDNMASACGCISLRRTRFRMTGFVVPWPSPLAPALNASSATGWRRYDQRPRHQDAHGAGPGHPPTRVTWKTAEILIEMLEAGRRALHRRSLPRVPGHDHRLPLRDSGAGRKRDCR